MSQQWNSGGDDVQMPLGVGVDSAGDGGFSEPSKPKMNTATLALVASFAAALVVIYLLGLQNKPRAASAEQTAKEQQVSAAITELLERNGKAEEIKSLFSDTKSLVQMFYSYLGSQSGTPPELPHDPFAAESTQVASALDSGPVVIPVNYAEAEKMRKVAETFGGLKLQSVMLSRTNSMAMINNKLVGVGSKLGDLTITEIESTRVLLTYGAQKFVLKLSRPNLDGSK